MCKFSTQSLILYSFKNRERKVREGDCAASQYVKVHTHTHTHTASASVLFEKDPVGFSGHVDSSLCETETKHLLCMASAPQRSCFL